MNDKLGELSKKRKLTDDNDEPSKKDKPSEGKKFVETKRIMKMVERLNYDCPLTDICKLRSKKVTSVANKELTLNRDANEEVEEMESASEEKTADTKEEEKEDQEEPIEKIGNELKKEQMHEAAEDGKEDKLKNNKKVKEEQIKQMQDELVEDNLNEIKRDTPSDGKKVVEPKRIRKMVERLHYDCPLTEELAEEKIQNKLAEQIGNPSEEFEVQKTEHKKEEVQEEQLEKIKDKLSEEKMEKIAEKPKEEQAEKIQNRLAEEKFGGAREVFRVQQIERTGEDVQEEQVERMRDELAKEAMKEMAKKAKAEQVEKIKNWLEEEGKIGSIRHDFQVERVENMKEWVQKENIRYELDMDYPQEEAHMKRYNFAEQKEGLVNEVTEGVLASQMVQFHDQPGPSTNNWEQPFAYVPNNRFIFPVLVNMEPHPGSSTNNQVGYPISNQTHEIPLAVQNVNEEGQFGIGNMERSQAHSDSQPQYPHLQTTNISELIDLGLELCLCWAPSQANQFFSAGRILHIKNERCIQQQQEMDCAEFYRSLETLCFTLYHADDTDDFSHIST